MGSSVTGRVAAPPTVFEPSCASVTVCALPPRLRAIWRAPSLSVRPMVPSSVPAAVCMPRRAHATIFGPMGLSGVPCLCLCSPWGRLRAPWAVFRAPPPSVRPVAPMVRPAAVCAAHGAVFGHHGLFSMPRCHLRHHHHLASRTFSGAQQPPSRPAVALACPIAALMPPVPPLFAPVSLAHALSHPTAAVARTHEPCALRRTRSPLMTTPRAPATTPWAPVTSPCALVMPPRPYRWHTVAPATPHAPVTLSRCRLPPALLFRARKPDPPSRPSNVTRGTAAARPTRGPFCRLAADARVTPCGVVFGTCHALFTSRPAPPAPSRARALSHTIATNQHARSPCRTCCTPWRLVAALRALSLPAPPPSTPCPFSFSPPLHALATAQQARLVSRDAAHSSNAAPRRRRSSSCRHAHPSPPALALAASRALATAQQARLGTPQDLATVCRAAPLASRCSPSRCALFDLSPPRVPQQRCIRCAVRPSNSSTDGFVTPPSALSRFPHRRRLASQWRRLRRSDAVGRHSDTAIRPGDIMSPSCAPPTSSPPSHTLAAQLLTLARDLDPVSHFTAVLMPSLSPAPSCSAPLQFCAGVPPIRGCQPTHRAPKRVAHSLVPTLSLRSSLMPSHVSMTPSPPSPDWYL
ncbi:hypothetical protein DENSPDRAFT_886539 [Dentipellis sp. KUC8613]|nr:hypothetical protein DENSPDRAFT_886539 [Dentipellis sp. KUC8613]